MKLRNKAKDKNNENKTNLQTTSLVHKIDLVREELNEFQKTAINLMFEAILNENENILGEHALCFKLEMENEEELKSKLRQLGGKVFILSSDPLGTKRYGLGLIGLLLTDKGKELERLLISYLDFVKSQLLIDPNRVEIKLKDVFEKLKPNDEEQEFLTLCLQVPNNPFGYVLRNPDLNISIPGKATKLGEAEDIEKYFHSILNDSIDKNFPIEAERQYRYAQEQYYAAGNGNNQNLLDRLPASFGTGGSFGVELAQQESILKKISWLHLTDLHRGMNQQRTLWASVREEFYRDLKRVAERSGLWDLVLFTGDLTQYGKKEDFDLLENTLVELWAEFNKLGCNPLLLLVPGNHDLLRPTADTKTFKGKKLDKAKKVEVEDVKLFDLWDRDKEIREAFWKDKNSKYRKIIEKVFSNYEEWQSKTKIPLAKNKKSDKCKYQIGLLPGDFSVSIEINSVRVGIVGVNSTFLQLKSGDFEGRLDINKSQADRACSGDLHKWVKENHINILMTHQPLSWLSQEAQKHFKANISDVDNFTFHIYGHMHEGSSEESSTAGSPTHREIQGTSLFGYEEWVTGNEQHIQRIHGYNAVYINITNDHNAEVRIWPRLLVTTRGGYYKLVADYNFDLDGDFYTRIVPLKKKTVAGKEEKLEAEKNTVSSEKEKTKKIILIDPSQGSLDIYRINDNRWNLELKVTLYVEEVVGVVVIPKHKSFIYLEFPNVMEKILINCNFKQIGQEGFVQVDNNSQVQIKGSGSFEVYGSTDVFFTDKFSVGQESQLTPKGSDIRVQMGLWLGQSKGFEEINVSIPLHEECGRYHFGD